MTYPPRDKFDFSLTKKFLDYAASKYPPSQEIDKEHPGYKYQYPDLVSYRALGAIFHNPLGDMMDVFISLQGYGLCADIEMSTMNCLEAYGLPQSMRKCENLLEDYHECLTGWRSQLRVDAMRYERQRQFLAGERKFQYAEPPKIGIFQY